LNFDIRTPPDVEIPQDITEFVGTHPGVHPGNPTTRRNDPLLAGIYSDLHRRSLSRAISSKRQLPRLLLLGPLLWIRLPLLSSILQKTLNSWRLLTHLPLGRRLSTFSQSSACLYGLLSARTIDE